MALAGPDGERAALLLRRSKREGAAVLSNLTRIAVARLVERSDSGLGVKRLFKDGERRVLTGVIAATNATAELLGRAKVRERWVQALRKHDPKAFAELALPPHVELFDEPDPRTIKPMPPAKALAYFQRLVPTISVKNPERFGALLERKAFTLAVDAERTLLDSVQGLIQDRIQTGKGISTAPAEIEALLSDAGVSPQNPQYAEMVQRTNMMCLLPGNSIQGRIVAASKGWYTGKAIEIVTRGGHHLTCTAKHPVLTADGFLAAGKVGQGKQLLRYVGKNKLSSARHDKEDAPALIEQVFESLAEAGLVARVVHPSAFDFHGDGQFLNGKVDVVRAARLLRSNLDSELAEFSGQDAFPGSSKGQVPFARLGGVVQPYPGAQQPRSDGIDRKPEANRQVSYGGARRVFADQIGGLDFRPEPMAAPNLDPDGSEFFPERLSLSEADPHGKRLKSFSVGVAPPDLGKIREVNRAGLENGFPRHVGLGAELDAGLLQPAGQEQWVDALLIRELLERFPGQVAWDEVIDIREFHYDGSVYDLQTSVGYYVAETVNRPDMMVGGFIVSNSAYVQGMEEERTDPEVMDVFPVWRYLGIRDGRQGEDHEPHFDNYYPNTTGFREVRGERVWNCRCIPQEISKWSWKELQAKGARVSTFSEEWVSGKIRKLRAEGKSQEQATAIALNMARDGGYAEQPGRVLLPVPDEAQDTDYSCGAAAFVAVARFFGIKPDTEAAAIKALGTSSADGTDPERIVAVATDHGLSAVALSGMTLADLEGHLRAGHPVICAIQAWGDPARYPANLEGHYVVAIGFDPACIWVMDPARFREGEEGPEYGGPAGAATGQRVVIPREHFLRVWHDVDTAGNVYARYGIMVGPLEG